MSYQSYGINQEITDAYRRTLIFNNDLLKEEYDKRYAFRLNEQVYKMRTSKQFSRPFTEEEIEKFQLKEARLHEARKQRYLKKLDDNVEPSVRRYAEGIKGLLGIS